MTLKKRIPCTSAQGVNVDSSSTPGRPHDKPPVRGSSSFTDHVEEIISEVEGHLIVIEQFLPSWMLRNY
jgi:hypothetical protein